MVLCIAILGMALTCLACSELCDREVCDMQAAISKPEVILTSRSH